LERERIFNDRYRIESRIGAGGMAIVYSGTDLLLRRRVAVKVLRDQFASDDGFVQRFSYEAQAAAKLSHPNIVAIYDFGRDGDEYFIVMELVEGSTLADIMHDDRTVPESVAIDYATQIAAGLAYAHRQGLLHRDVKPANILVTRDDVVKLSDFGIARAIAENVATVTQPGMVMGSVAYVSPEQAQGHELDERSDLYSLGVVLYQMIGGRLPFRGETPVAVALKHVSEPAPPLDRRNGAISPALASIAERLLQKSPADRFASAGDLARALREAREQPAVAGAGLRSFGDAPTAPIGRVAPQPPPRPSAAPDQPSRNGAPVRTQLDEPAGRDRRWLPFVVLLLAAAVLGYFSVRLLGPPRDIPLTDLTGRSATVASQQLVAAGLRPEVRLETSETIPLDRVIRQEPAAGSAWARNDVVTLFVSSGMPSGVIPDVKGYTRADAEHALTAAKFKVKFVARFDRAPKDSVIDVQPGGGRQVPLGTAITLTVSKGEAPVRVPQLVGMPLDAARNLLAKTGLKLNVDQESPSDMIPKDTIASQAAAVDAQVDRGSTIGVSVSTGPLLTTVPDASGKSIADASSALTAAGFVPRIQYIVDAANATGTVVAQDPVAGITAARRSPITISVAVPGTVPDVTGMSLEDAKRAFARTGYVVASVEVTPDGTEGKVSRTDPAPNTALRPGEHVTIYYHPTGAR
jgi:beta-lactam-binding protein with PASTA domain/tRNA A-37 threonylcarbamoyl transferase component Bud32